MAQRFLEGDDLLIACRAGQGCTSPRHGTNTLLSKGVACTQIRPASSLEMAFTPSR